MTKISDRFRELAQNNEMIDQHFTESGRGLNEAADTIERLQREREMLRNTLREIRREADAALSTAEEKP